MGFSDNWLGAIFSIRPDGNDFRFRPILPTQFGFSRGGSGVVGTLALDGDALVGIADNFGFVGPTVFRVTTEGTEIERFASPASGWVTAGVTVAEHRIFGTAYHTSPMVNRYALGHIFLNGGLLYGFTGYSDDAGGVNSIVRSGDSFYGTTAFGGTNLAGTLFRAKTDGTDFSILFSFPSGSKGRTPGSRLTINGTTLFGIARASESSNVIYRVEVDGSRYTILHRYLVGYENSEAGDRPPFLVAPVFFNERLYGAIAGPIEPGIFRMNPDGSEFRLLSPIITGELTVGENAMYGMAIGTNNATSLVRINAADEVKVIHNIPASQPLGRLALIGQNLFGVVRIQRVTGTVETRAFRCATNGTHFVLLAAIPGDPSASTLVTDGKALYCTSRGNSEPPTVFQLSPNSTNATLLYQFPTNRGILSGFPPVGWQVDPSQVDTELLVENDALYGSTFSGGDAGQGTIFRLDLRPRLEIALTPGGVALSWPLFAAGTNYILESASNLSLGNWTLLAEAQAGPSNILHLPSLSRATFFRMRTL